MIELKNRKRTKWKRLDNAAKIFPPTSTDKDTKVFRFALELYEYIEADILQEALDITMESFPFYMTILRRGMFWDYFEKTDNKAIVEMENNTICAPIYFPDEKELLFRVLYYGKRINIEIHHSLTDGTGAVWLLNTLTYHYLTIKYKEEFEYNKPQIPYNQSISKKTDDSFQKYYTGNKKIKYQKQTKAYRINGTRAEDNRNIYIEGSMSVKSVLKEAHKYKTTLTGYLASLFIYSMYKDMSVRQQKDPIVLSVPVNLRRYFDSGSARNFFGTIRIEYNFSEEGDSFDNIVNTINLSLKENLTEEKLNNQLNRFMALENNKLAKIVPLPIKNVILRIADVINERGITAGISNLGRITFPEEFHPYIYQISVCTAARRPQLSICSYNDNLTLGFTSPFIETSIQHNLFEFLSKAGIGVNIASNIEEVED